MVPKDGIFAAAGAEAIPHQERGRET